MVQHGRNLTTDRALRRTPRGAELGVTALAVIIALVLVAGNLLGSRHVAAAPKPLKIVAFGDSLTAGFGLAPAEGFTAVLQNVLNARGLNVEVVNSGVSGDTAAAGLERLDWAIPDDAAAVIVELGANDALRGIDPAITRATLDTILTRLAARKLPVLLAGMKSPQSWGRTYEQAFDALFADLAKSHGAALYPFFLDGVALDPALNQADGIHPNAKGVAVIVERIAPAVTALVAKAAAARPHTP